MFAVRAPGPIEHELTELAAGLESVDMRAAHLLAPELVDERDRIVRTIRGYLIPRLTDASRPMTVVIAGPTGSGKSTIINSLAGLEVAETGPLRPTTRTPLVLTTSEHADRFQELGGVRCHVSSVRSPILSHLALVDTPDIDSTSVEHRKMTERLIDTADVVVFVTSASRYADRVPWEVLRRAVERGAPLIAVLNRVTPAAAGAVSDYRARLARADIEAAVIRLPEQRGGPALGRVPSLAVKDLSRRLRALAGESDGGRLAGRNVAAAALADSSRLCESLTGLTRLFERQREQIEKLVDRGGARLDLAPALEGLSLPDRAFESWRPLLPLPLLSARELSEWLEGVGARLSAGVESELRTVAMELETHLPSTPSGAIIEPALVTMVTAIDGWLAHVRRITEGIGWRKRHLATAILVMRSLGLGDDDHGRQLLGASTAALAEGARADLERRLTVAFSQLAAVSTARLQALAGPGPPEDIVELITRVRARLTFADA